MDKTYDPHAMESHWSATWESEGYFTPSNEGPAYCIMIPPPNVTGTLHMGHGFQQSIMDTLTRYHRMQGNNTLWQVGVDHAGIATQMVVERRLEQAGSSRHKLGREAFLDEVTSWREESGNTITGQMRRLGNSVDWETEAYTMDPGFSAAVQKVFIKLFKEGVIYRGNRLVNWDPKFNTAISDLEVLSEEENGHMWHIRYPLSDGSGHLVIATTRPETLLGDAAVAVHPEDARYKDLVGTTLNLPLCDRTIPIIVDEYVDPAFGTGCVKITPAHDFNDYEVGKRHNLPQLNILTKSAKINTNAPTAYQGMDRFDARKKIVSDLDALGLIEKIDDHKLMIPRGDRSGVVIEPLLTDQWYVKADTLAAPALKAVRSGKIKFIPENWDKTYYQWLENIQDWCISRQLWWGHRIPAWYDDEGQFYVGADEAAVRREHKLDESIALAQDDDVLDTWFSSALWPFATLGWPEQTDRLQQFYPTSVLVTGFDIIFFWVARMIMMGLHFMGDVPFHEVYITGLIRDSHGQKMSKSKGNVLDPIDLIDGIELDALVAKRTHGMMQPHLKDKITKATKKEFPNGINSHGTDAVRFTFCALATQSRDINFDLSRLEGNRNFCNKIWNASRYVLMNTESQSLGDSNSREFSLADKWILSRLQSAIAQTHQHLKAYRFDLACQTLYEFTWNQFCDWYLELSKPVLTQASSNESALAGTRYTLVTVLETLLRLLHPMMPFITEEIWQRTAPLLGKHPASIMQAAFPQVDEALSEPGAEADIEWIKQVTLGIRIIRGEMNISPNKAIPLYLARGNTQTKARLDANQGFLSTLAKLSEIHWLEAGSEPPPSATSLVDELELHIPLAGLIDKSAETTRLQKALAKLDKELQRTQKKLENPSYVANAPEAVVTEERAREQDWLSQRAKLEAQVVKLQSLD